MASATKDRKRLFRELERNGWSVEKRKGGHVKITAPGGRGCYFTGSTPSAQSANHRLLADLRKMGYAG